MKPVIIALDFENRHQTEQFLTLFDAAPKKPVIKVGMELFYREGPAFVRDLAAQGYAIFLDLKLMDIPHTVEMAMQQLAQLGIAYTTIHANGGSAMIQAAKKGLTTGAAKAGLPTPKLLAVTELTSITPAMLKDELHVDLPMQAEVVALAELAQQNGADGVICSPQEVPALQQHLPQDFLFVTPGIRPVGAAKDDQARVATPAEAAQLGSSAIVVGRPITLSQTPFATYQQIRKEFNAHD
ncbi:orotidine-5-phosphate decarboxylase [Lactobacillus selangorensis]|uniref:Orotidine 5'-phosphate decarboxylase n=1 Tax=Lactobacillus selangorensis TaxID=81857 RepID=A0A0R2FJE4_9LACO|nr:orotidine-5'-phosphate decarboxylase [Lactobacillus selangorensis]KRN28672.1 orotidine-5-phosphate decarboxylase [Lactobacillus selangorensis]KRN32918.1 orotidine-5-phosphate decarboxylase [Lactobacillus selangorensis]